MDRGTGTDERQSTVGVAYDRARRAEWPTADESDVEGVAFGCSAEQAEEQD
jgi:hypothetical protein